MLGYKTIDIIQQNPDDRRTKVDEQTDKTVERHVYVGRPVYFLKLAFTANEYTNAAWERNTPYYHLIMRKTLKFTKTI